MRELLLVIFILIGSLNAISQTIDVAHEKKTQGLSEVSILVYKARYNDRVFTMRFAQFENLDSNGYMKEFINLIVSVDEYYGEIYIVYKDRTKLELTKSEEGYQYYGPAKELGPILGLQLDDVRLIFDKGEETEDIYGDLKRARSQM